MPVDSTSCFILSSSTAVLDLSVSGAFTEKYGRAFCGGEQLHGTFHRFIRRNHCRTWIYGLEEQLVGISFVHYRTETGSCHVKIYTTGPSRYGSAVCAGHRCRDILGFIHAIGSFYKAFGYVELIKSFVGALIEVYRFAHA